MCLSNLTADVKNWSTDLSVSSTVNIEAALFNEHMLAWEPLIEPTMDPSGSVLSPWCITCSIVPVSINHKHILRHSTHVSSPSLLVSMLISVTFRIV